ncbi:competence protein [Virgibacillus profundi]|uniref:Competence protein n=1 Tax=Virgibacillus profundi TaxID=2024555 RepID=A0A2A2IAR9_9BACI|nr:competence protein ComK [Virgibacillus profundi]PAV28416.1 competence protein [Virgibacillus profundi]PXY52222.1 competence protein [Virgibacillus profundi]
MEKIMSHYKINEQTIALLPARHMDYASIVYEHNQQLFVRKTPIQLIKTACLDYCSTYEGRREAVIYHTGFRRKVPIPISISKNIYTFPTHSPSDYDCTWIFYNHVKSFISNPSSKKLGVKSIITFKTGQQLPLNVSPYIIEKQMKRTAMCKFRFSDCVGNGDSDYAAVF